MIKVRNLHKSFGDLKITQGLDLEIEQGEFLAIIGGSGGGKSVLIKQMVGLIDPDKGEVLIKNKNITKLKGDKKEFIFKTCGYVFQFGALLDSLNVLENIGITLLEAGQKLEDIRDIVVEKLKDVGLSEEVLEKFPSELSGGMKKRVALARTLVREPEVLFYDEPTTGLDPITVTMIHQLMLDTHKKTKATTIVISHDIEIFKYATQVAMLYKGKIIFKGPAKTIWESKNKFVYQFIRGLATGPI
jgi:phospholipid/cholesterol/gamma-HCH transport system ATP-binding protein